MGFLLAFELSDLVGHLLGLFGQLLKLRTVLFQPGILRLRQAVNGNFAPFKAGSHPGQGDNQPGPVPGINDVLGDLGQDDVPLGVLCYDTG